MSTIGEKTDRLFMDATLRDDALGYPDDVAFLPGDEDWAEDVLWRNLVGGVPTVLVGAEVELLLTPRRRGPLDRLRGRVRVNVAHRVHGHATPYVTVSSLGRHPLSQMRRLAHA